MAKMLLAAGANVKATTRDGEITPLFMACTNGDAAMIEALLKAGADANSVKSQRYHGADDRGSVRATPMRCRCCSIMAPISTRRNPCTARPP